MANVHEDLVGAGQALSIENYASSRLTLFDRLLKRRGDVVGGSLWIIQPAAIRFKLGESLTELKIPYHVGVEDDACVEDAVMGLSALLKKRAEPSGKDAAQTSPVKTPPLKDKTFRTDIFLGGAFEKKLALEILSSTPSLDTAILAAWLAPDGHGKKFLSCAGALMEKAVKEEARLASGEPTAYLALLAIINTVRKKKEKIKDVRVKGLTYEKLDLAVSLALFTALKTAVKEVFTKMLGSGAASYNPATEAIVLSAIVPKAFASIPSSILATSLNPYGINAETFDALSRVIGGLNKDITDISGVIDECAVSVRQNDEALLALRQLNETIRFRQEALNFLGLFDMPGAYAYSALSDAFNEDRLIKNLLGDAKAVSAVISSVEDIKDKFSKDRIHSEAADSLIGFLSSFKKKAFSGLLSKKEHTDIGLASALTGYWAYRLDNQAEEFAGRMRNCLTDRREEFNQETLIEEYNRGRLYRFSTDGRLMLKTIEVTEEGQFFIDMKDFTKKTLKVKELAMAEFMRDNFYRPILTAAKKYSAGIGVKTDERGIWLTNLAGDAAIFSGGVAYLVALARDIQKIITRYREELIKKLPPSGETSALGEVHKLFEFRKESFKQKRREIEAAFGKYEDVLKEKLTSLDAEEHRHDNAYRDSIEEAIRGELAAGLYISYGRRAETLSFESQELGGRVKVAIGEKINEAARGTNRNVLVRAKLEVLLENERLRKKNSRLKYPFDIYIERTYHIKMPSELENAFEKLVASKKQASAVALAKLLASEFLNDLNKVIQAEPFSSLKLITASTDIYNKGQALSGDALAAYIKETKGDKLFFKKIARVAELDTTLQSAFFFPYDSLELWFGVESMKDATRVEIFYKSGEVVFRGFEAQGPAIVYEMINPDGDFYHAVMERHFSAWLADEKAKAGLNAF